jgi:photosystem II stability/assembly factor-like uncharacterized protein
MKLLLLSGILGLLISSACTHHSGSEQYTWGNLKIGGGGYVLGMVIHPDDPGLFYIRTDVGGAYRYDGKVDRMVPLFDWVPYEKANLYGINGLALHPDNKDVVYAACGKYPDWRPSDVYFSDDRGNSWTPTGLNKPFSGNAHPNRQGHILQVDPYRPHLVWCGTTGEGLWRLKDGNWSRVEDIPHQNVVRTISFHPSDSLLFFVAVSHSINRGHSYGDPALSGIFRTTDGGNTFTRTGSLPENVHQFTEMDFSKSGERVYLSVIDHSGSRGGIFRLEEPHTGSDWKEITPPFEAGYRTINSSPHNDDVVMTAPGIYNGLTWFFVSIDGGDSWIRKENHDVHNIIPWHPDTYPGSAISCIAFDPVDPKMVYFTDWYSVYRTGDWTADTISWSNSIAKGHEEIVPSRILSAHPRNSSNAILYVGGADISGLTIQDIHEYPEFPNWRSLAGSDLLQEVSGIDFCESDPDIVVACGGEGWDMEQGGVGVSFDGGTSFRLATGFNPAWGGGRVAVSAEDPENSVVLTNQAGILYSEDGGATFTPSAGVSGTYDMGRVFSTCHPLCSDRVNGDFYLFDRRTGDLLVSTDGGGSFIPVARIQTAEPDYINLVAVQDHPGHLWLTLGKDGLWYSENGGKHWSQMKTFTNASLLAAGKPQPGTEEPSIYVWGIQEPDSAMYFYRADRADKQFNKVNSKTQAGDLPRCLAADRSVYGRFYVATNGRGIYYAALSDD